MDWIYDVIEIEQYSSSAAVGLGWVMHHHGWQYDMYGMSEGKKTKNRQVRRPTVNNNKIIW
ncbi:MAG: hypothetical protein ACR2IS_14260 [Nitrososphaeraceae archaeon]